MKLLLILFPFLLFAQVEIYVEDYGDGIYYIEVIDYGQIDGVDPSLVEEYFDNYYYWDYYQSYFEDNYYSRSNYRDRNDYEEYEPLRTIKLKQPKKKAKRIIK